MTTTRRTFALTLCAFVIGVVFCLLVLELLLVIAQVNTKSNIRFIPGMGTTYIPHAYYRHAKEGFSEGYFNSHGFRDYERPFEKPKGTFRILVLGDSYVEAFQVSLEDAFPALLERKLNENSASHRFEVLNLGQSGFGTADEYMRYLNFGVKYRPDLVLLAFLTGNDIRNNAKILNREELGFYFVLDKSGQLVLDRSIVEDYEQSLTSAKRLIQFIKQRSYLASLVSERFYLLRLQLQERRIKKLLSETKKQRLWNRDHRTQKEPDELSDLNIYLENMSERWREAFAITKALLLKFKQSVENNDGQFLLATLSNAEQVHPELQQELRERYGLPFDFEQPDRNLEEFAQRHQITYLKLMPVFHEYHLRTGSYLHGFGGSKTGHWNQKGHRLAADTIFEFLNKNHLLPAGEVAAHGKL
jgi:lysophospholipase L1-like esterase